jgi:hypothetical protein
MVLRKQIKWEKDKQKKKKYTQRGPYTDKWQLESRRYKLKAGRHKYGNTQKKLSKNFDLFLIHL